MKQSEKPTGSPPRLRGLFGYLLIALLALWGWQFIWGSIDTRTLTYSDFKQHLAEGHVKEVLVEESEVRGVIEIPAAAPAAGEAKPEAGEAPAAGEAEESKPETFNFRAVRVEDPDLVKELQEAKVEFTGSRPSAIGQFLLVWILPIGFILLIWFFVFRFAARGASGQVMSFGKSKAKLVAEEGTGVDFNDVAGCDEAKQELTEMVDFLRDPDRFTRLGAKIPKGVLLLGPPGTGKTLLARAVAGEAKVPFFSISGSDFVEMFVGVGAARVRDLFEQAKKKAPCIVFIDEIDAVGRQRGVQIAGGNDEREQTLNQLLAEMDGFEANVGVIILAATNRPEILDRALLRPGRFDRQVVLDSPDVEGREAILKIHSRDKPLDDAVDLRAIAQATPGFSGADLANTMNEAALLAARRKQARIFQADLEEAVEKVVAGPERRSRRLGAEEKRRVAFHESGHALVAFHCKTADPVRKISIVPRGRAALGFTLQLPEEQQFLMTRIQLLERLAVMLGGRAAEEAALGEISTGAQNDLEQATALARQMVCVFGMSDRVGLSNCARPAGPQYLEGLEGALRRDCSEETAREIDEEVKRLLEEALQAARKTLGEHRPQLDHLAAALLERETLDRKDFEAILAEPVPAKT